MYARPKLKKNEYAREEECGRVLPTKQGSTPSNMFNILLTNYPKEIEFEVVISE